jgi:hypothetical protein
MKLASALFVATVVLASACSSTTPVSNDEACTTYAKSVCTRADKCSHFLVQYVWGDETTCEVRAKASCGATVTAPGSAVTASDAQACAKAVDAAGCDFLDHNPPKECQSKPGNHANGAGCVDSSQCVSMHCKKPTDATCGTCADAVLAGGTCALDEDCPYGNKCVQTVCVAPGDNGGTCDDKHPCKNTLTCQSGKCAAPLAAGATCDPNAKACDATQGYYCEATTKVCTQIAQAAGGGACGYASGVITVCNSGGVCSAALPASGTCSAAAADLATCDIKKGPSCLNPAQCVNGKCQLPNGPACETQ